MYKISGFAKLGWVSVKAATGRLSSCSQSKMPEVVRPQTHHYHKAADIQMSVLYLLSAALMCQRLPICRSVESTIMFRLFISFLNI
jgi:hypothetical protein